MSVERPRRVKGLPSKALLQWRGPYTVTAISRRGYTCRDENGQVVTISRTYLAPYTASGVAASEAISEIESSLPGPSSAYSPGQLIFIGDHAPDEEGNFRFQLAQFKSLSDGDPDWLSVDYLGTTTSKSPYKFSNVWIDDKDGKAILRNAKPAPGGGVSDQVSQWAGIDPAAHVLPIQPVLTKNGVLSAATIKSLGKWKPNLVR